jgi:hypothetical protein
VSDHFDPAPNVSEDGRNTPLSKAEVYEAEDGRPGLLLKRKHMGADGEGWDVAMVKAGMVVTGWVSDDDLAAGRKWRPVLPGEAAAELVRQAERIEELEGEREAFVIAMRKAVEMLPPAGAQLLRSTYRGALPQ